MLPPFDAQPEPQLQLHQGVGLGQVVVSAGQQAANAVICLDVGREEEYRHAARLAQPLAHRHAVEPRHIHVENDAVQCRALGDGQSAPAVPGAEDLVALLFEIGRVDF